MNDHEVISAFLDDEPFDANELKDALGDPAGRDLLIDVIALRHLTNLERLHGRQTIGRESRRVWSRVAVAAAVLLSLVGGYAVGTRRDATAADTPPPATRVLDAPGAWQVVPAGKLP